MNQLELSRLVTLRLRDTGHSEDPEANHPQQQKDCDHEQGHSFLVGESEQHASQGRGAGTTGRPKRSSRA